MINIKEMEIHNASFKVNHIEGESFNIPAQFGRSIDHINDGRYLLTLTINVKNEKDKPFPFDLECAINAYFECDNNETEDEAKKYIAEEGTAIVFPYLRSYISTLTSASMIPPLVLPIIDLAKIFDDKL
ncbi:MAG: protein-export chaperone SecB [Bacteroides sp.]|nr:protein-export chaperone SecB [Bacillota bacterium]MCM1393627.1 protein-export chaperone SecB [[Eubacterium] siraeum]MCM1454973.1 protein-export chaperone SecB [Bacteroides sp.]